LDFSVDVIDGHMSSCQVYVGCCCDCSSLSVDHKPEELDMAANWPFL
jgi:hypothetical protein